MTKEDFLQDPVTIFWSGKHQIPQQWIKEAWSLKPFRENATSELIRSVRKNGDFFIAQYWLDLLPSLLSEQEVIELYNAIRDNSGRVEHEWREQFLKAFQQYSDTLPPPRTTGS
jgi:hypothetical protein